MLYLIKLHSMIHTKYHFTLKYFSNSTMKKKITVSKSQKVQRFFENRFRIEVKDTDASIAMKYEKSLQKIENSNNPFRRSASTTYFLRIAYMLFM